MATIRALWGSGGQLVNRDSRYFPLRNALFDLPPYRGKWPEIWIGAHGPRMLRAAGRYGDGYFPGFPHRPQDYAQRLEVVRAAASDAGRDPMSIIPALWLWVVTARNRDDVDEALDSEIIKSWGGAEIAVSTHIADGEAAVISIKGGGGLVWIRSGLELFFNPGYGDTLFRQQSRGLEGRVPPGVQRSPPIGRVPCLESSDLIMVPAFSPLGDTEKANEADPVVFVETGPQEEASSAAAQIKAAADKHSVKVKVVAPYRVSLQGRHYVGGDVVDVDTDTANTWLKSKWAEPVSQRGKK
jgi:hypothetical protein